MLAQHDERLQSLRGLAALTVVIGHGLIVLPASPFSIVAGAIFQQGSAVVFFYVLSGFVLGQSLFRDDRAAPFAIRRLARLLPVYWASLALATMVSIAVAGPPIEGASDWYNYFLSVDTSPQAIALNAVALSTNLNHVMWSVQIELLVIPLLPLAAILVRRLSAWQVLAALVVICLASRYCLARFYLRPIAYFYCFYIGLLIPRALSSQLRPFIRDGRLVALGLSGLIAVYALSINSATKYILDAFVSAHIIAYIASSPAAASFLRHRALVWIGDISYSLYALAQIVLIVVAYSLFQPSNWWTDHPVIFSLCLIALNVAIILPIAWASYRWIEIPGMMLGRILVARSGSANRTAGDVA